MSETCDAAAPAKARAHPEWDLQTAAYVWARKFIADEFLWLSIDRGAGSKMQRIREAARGFQPGTPDALIATRAVLVGIEFKAERGKVSDAQSRMGERFAAVRARWYVAHSVVEMCKSLISAGVSLRDLAIEHAEAADRALAIRAAKPRKPPAPSKDKRYTWGKGTVRRARKAGVFI